MAHDEVLQDGLEIQRKPAEAPYMLLEAHREKVRRGKVLTLVPVGYVRTEDDGIEITPDRQVQEAVRGIFQKFRELGSIRQVLLWLSTPVEYSPVFAG